MAGGIAKAKGKTVRPADPGLHPSEGPRLPAPWPTHATTVADSSSTGTGPSGGAAPGRLDPLQAQYGNAVIAGRFTRMTAMPAGLGARPVATGVEAPAHTAGTGPPPAGAGRRPVGVKGSPPLAGPRGAAERQGSKAGPGSDAAPANAKGDEAKGKDQDRDKSAKPGRGRRPGAAGPARRDGDDRGARAAPEKGAGSDKGGDAGAQQDQAAEAPPTSAVDIGAEELEPITPPRLEGTQATRLSPPNLNPQQLNRVRTQTGFTLAEHYARVQVHLDRLADRATSEQFAIVSHIDLIATDARRELENGAAQIPAWIAGAIDTVRAACGGARATIKAASEQALATIDKHATDAHGAVDAAALSSKEAVEKAVLASSPRVQALYEETMAPLRTLLGKTALQFSATGLGKAKDMLDEGDRISKGLLTKGGGAIDLAMDEKRAKAATDVAIQGSMDLLDAGIQNAAAVVEQEPTLGLSFLGLVNPVAVKVAKVGAADAGTVATKGAEVGIRLATDSERARGFVEETAKRALKALDAMEAAAVKQLEQLGQGLEAMARARTERLYHAILASQAPAADAWAQQMARANQLVSPDQLVDWRHLEPGLVEALAAMGALSTSQRAEFDAQARAGLSDATTALDGDRRSIDLAADAFVSGVRETRAQAEAMAQVAQTFADGFRGTAQPASASSVAFRLKAEEKLGLTVEATRKQMGELLDRTTVALDENVTAFGTRLDEQIKAVEPRLADTFAEIGVDMLAKDKPDSLPDRAGRALSAMDRVGTDETGLFAALHAMTPKLGRALESYWDDTHHYPTLRRWLDSELSGDDWDTAFAYLNGDPVAGAKYELKAAKHWYVSDVTQAESALRALGPDELQRLRNDGGFAEVKAKLESGLGGTDLQVTQALVAGRTARADALRLREQIDEARAQGDDDKLHDALAAVDPRRLPEIRQELVDVLAGHAMAEAPPQVKDEEAIAAFTTYVTRPVEVEVPGDPEGPSQTITLTLSEPSKQLATALATTGEGTPEARAARLAFETRPGGDARPERMAKALEDPKLVAARANPNLTKTDADPVAVERARKAVAEAEAERDRTMLQFAALKHADAAAQKDPARAREFAEQAVGSMFGDDALGRELGVSMVRDGRADPAVAIKYAVRGWGTNEELIRHTLKGMKAEDIAKLKEDYARRFGKGNANKLFDDLGVFQNADTAKAAGVEHAKGGGFFTELSGDERQEVEELLLGTPQNDRDRWRLARLQYQHQRGEGTGWLGGALEATAPVPGMENTALSGMAGPSPGQALDMNRAQMEEMVDAAGGEKEAFDEHGNFKGVDGKFTVTDFRVHTGGTSEAAENYKHHIDSIADMITGAIAIIGAIIGTVVVTVLSAGTATPLVIGLWAAGIAAATGAAAMAANYAIKGSRYGWEQAAVDGALTLLDAATAGLMAGAGAKAMTAVKELEAIKAVARTPSQVAAAERLAARHGEKELARGFVRAATGAGISGTARTAMADGTWDKGVLSGLGQSVGGGLKAAAIGAATHGATTGFQRTGLGQALGKSTNYARRGLGAGLGGAIGSMAGRSSELTLDALGGHQQQPWDEALLSVVAAGGRGFAENMAQGMAEVPKARRDAAHEQLTLARRAAENDRVARYGMTDEDVAADAGFRRRAGAAAAHLDDAGTAKAFLDELDAGVAADRSRVETHRQLVRTFRREALSGIPPERRGEFANVSIHVLENADFERFTGSRSGLAVTIIVDGEAQIVVRRGVDPEALREEGLHVLQSRDPRWRDRVARLDEATLGRWHELDLETQFSLYRNKLEIELDAQERLRQGLLGEAEQTTDAARRAALFLQAEEAETTHAALKARRDEVDGITPDRRAAIRRGEQELPQYLREPARLFAKRSPKPPRLLELQPERLPQRETPLDHDSPELGSQPRRRVGLKNSTWEEDYPNHRIYQVGDVWMEPETYQTRGGNRGTRNRWYRMVEVTKMVDGVEVVVDRRREILQRGRNGRWQQRGSESSAWGTLFEETSRQRTLARTRDALGRDILPDVDPVVPVGALRRHGDESGRPLSAQHGGGAGFDDVVFEFRRVNGREEAHIVIIEAKGYKRSLTLEEFSAITTNLDVNLAKLRTAVAGSDLGPLRIDAIVRAIQERRLSFEVHTSTTTGLGEIRDPRAMILRDIVDTEEARRQLAFATEHLSRLPRTSDPEELQQRGQHGARLAQLRDELKKAYGTDPFQPDRVRRALAAILHGGTEKRPSIAQIAASHGLDLGERRAVIRQVSIDPRKADRLHLQKAEDVIRAARNFRRAGTALGMVEQLGLSDRKLDPVETAAHAPRDVALVRSSDGQRTLAVTRPTVVVTDAGVETGAARQLVELLRDGVPVPGGVVRPDRLLWDAAGTAAPAIGVVLDQVRKSLASHNGDPTRLRILVDSMVTNDEVELRQLLGLPKHAKVRPITRSPQGSTTWVIWLPAEPPAASRKPRR